MENDKFQELVIQQLEKMNSRMDKIDTRFDGIEAKVDKIDASQVRMETDLTEKVRGLYDAWVVQNEFNEKVIQTLDRIEAKVDVLQLETAHLRRVK